MHQLSSISSYVPYSFLSVIISRVELKLSAGSMSRLKATKMTNTAFISSSSFRKLRNQVFDNKNLRKDTKVMVYKAVCITTLFYRRRGLLIDVIKRPWRNSTNVVSERYVVSDGKIRTNTSVLMEASTTSVEAMVKQNQLHWAGHCIKMLNNRLRQLFAQLTHGVRTRADRRKRFKDTAKHYTKKSQIDINAWELMAVDRPLWRRSIFQATAKFETNCLLHEAEKRQRRKERETSANLESGS